VQGDDVGGSEDHVERVCEALRGEDAENVPLLGGEASGETAVGLGLDGQHSSVCEGDFKFYRLGSSTLRSLFAFRIIKGVSMVCVAITQCVLYDAC